MKITNNSPTSVTIEYQREYLSEAQVVEMLISLPRLAKPHYSWPIDYSMMLGNRVTLEQYARVTGAVSLGVGIHKPDTDVRLTSIAKEVCRVSDARIALNYSPFYTTFQRGELLDREDIPAITEELKRIDELFGKMKELCGDYVDAILLDSEIFDVRTDGTPQSVKHNQYMDGAHSRVAFAIRKHFPAQRIEWYGRHQRMSNLKDGVMVWQGNSHLTDNTPGSSTNTALYHPHELLLTIEQYQKTAYVSPIKPVNPWLMLGSGLQYDRYGKRYTEKNLDYPYDNDWHIGKFLANQSACECVMFYPTPGTINTRDWWRHFEAYCEGSMDLL